MSEIIGAYGRQTDYGVDIHYVEDACAGFADAWADMEAAADAAADAILGADADDRDSREDEDLLVQLVNAGLADTKAEVRALFEDMG